MCGSMCPSVLVLSLFIDFVNNLLGTSHAYRVKFFGHDLKFSYYLYVYFLFTNRTLCTFFIYQPYFMYNGARDGAVG
jgi:hypothetical protein